MPARLFAQVASNVVLALCTITRPHNVGQHLLIDLNALRMLGTRQFSFSPSVHVEPSLPVVDPALFMCMVNRLGVDGALNVAFDALNGLEDEVGRQVGEFLDAAVSDNCGVAVPHISEETDFDYGEMPAKAGVGFVFTPDMLKAPFEFRLVPGAANA